MGKTIKNEEAIEYVKKLGYVVFKDNIEFLIKYLESQGYTIVDNNLI